MRRALLATIGLCAAAATQAQVLRDPTRPPLIDAGIGTSAEAVSAQRLQSTLLSSGRRLAVIDGQTFALGGKVGDARVLRISETEVVLQRGADTEVLKLHPSVAKTTRIARQSTRQKEPTTRTGKGDTP